MQLRVKNISKFLERIRMANAHYVSLVQMGQNRTHHQLAVNRIMDILTLIESDDFDSDSYDLLISMEEWEAINTLLYK